MEWSSSALKRNAFAEQLRLKKAKTSSENHTGQGAKGSLMCLTGERRALSQLSTVFFPRYPTGAAETHRCASQLSALVAVRQSLLSA